MLGLSAEGNLGPMSSQPPLPRFVDALYVLSGPGTLLSRAINAAALLVDVDAQLLPDHHRLLFNRFRKVMSPEFHALLPVTDSEARFWAGWITETTLELIGHAPRASVPSPRSIPAPSERPSLAPN